MKNSDQPAFSVSKEMCECSEITEYPFGLTKREYFASLVIQGLLASVPSNEKDLILYIEMKERIYGNISVNSAIAKEAVSIADALLNELNS